LVAVDSREPGTESDHVTDILPSTRFERDESVMKEPVVRDLMPAPPDGPRQLERCPKVFSALF